MKRSLELTKATGNTHLRTKHTIVFVTHIDVIDELGVEPK